MLQNSNIVLQTQMYQSVNYPFINICMYDSDIICTLCNPDVCGDEYSIILYSVLF